MSLRNKDIGKKCDDRIYYRTLCYRYNIPLPGSEPRYVALPGEDSVFGDVYGGSDAYVKLFDTLSTAEPQYHYPNLETTSKG